MLVRLRRHVLARSGLGLALAAALAAACSSPKPPPPAPIQEPPVVDLSRIGTLGMVDFAAADGGELGRVAREEFLAAVLSAQPGSPVLELGAQERALASVGGGAIDPETVRALGKKYQVDALLVGELRIGEMAPRLAVREVSSIAAAVEVDGALNARILETQRGATIWSASALGRVPVANVRVNAWGMPSLNADRVQQARLALVRDLVAQATADFQPRWVQP